MAEQRDIVRKRETKLNNYREQTRAAAHPVIGVHGLVPSPPLSAAFIISLFMS